MRPTDTAERRAEPHKDEAAISLLEPVDNRQQRLALVDACCPATSDGLELTVANAGDHTAIHCFLTAVFQGPSHDGFMVSLDDPFYEPCDRLLVKRGHQVVAHVHLTHRVMRFGPLGLPASGLTWLATLPEFRSQGLAGELLRLAERFMVEDGTAVGVLRTKIPHYFRRHGWAVCGRHCISRASTRDLLSQLSTPTSSRRQRRMTVRPWRQVELTALMRLFQQATIGRYGAFDRTEAYWRWMISGHAYDQIYVAVDGPDRGEADEFEAPIVGYAITREDEILELMTEPGHLDAARALLARACRDCIERDHHAVVYHGPPNDHVQSLFDHACGTRIYHEAQQGEVFMFKLLDPVGLLHCLGSELQRRAHGAGMPPQNELGLMVDGDKYQLVVSRRGAKIARRRLGRSYLRMNGAEFTRLLLGHVDLEEAISGGRIESSTRVAVETAKVLFPQLPLWRPPLDDVMT